MKKPLYNVPKRLISLLLAITCTICLITLPSCGGTNSNSVVSIDGVDISNDVFTYFLDKATADVGLDSDTASIKNLTLAYITTYFKTNSLAGAHGIKLTIAEKAAVSETVNGYWQIYDQYYKKIGVTKETLTKVFTADAYRDRLILSYYGEGGTEEIPLTRLYATFKTNYVLFQSVTGYLTETDEAGNSVQLPQNEIEALILRFQSMAGVVNSGEKDMEEASEYLAQAGIQSTVQTVILHKDDESYPAGFFQKVQSIDTHYAAIIGTNEYIFLVLKAELDPKSTYFEDKKVEIIKSLVGNEIDKIIDGAYETESDVSTVNFNSYLELIKTQKGEK